ncbi:216_t:CDS:2 [Funneliformis geosporum]|uniref:15988_t:CDS:1 n=1 Tax=Funneliformis geosporum TaxID=1117311 RepID=A0A9W4SRM3_9GLOM|nr:216_t:CDS:2 [Funneliformis geosporum]CAI2177981.1 15988_t:CDS:2 [Funneliformis geosporum]
MERKKVISNVQQVTMNNKEFQHLKNIPEFSSFEHQKENILPVKQGRSAAALSQIFSSEPSALYTELQAGHDKFNAELENLDELDDPFDVYDRYIKWTMENYPQASGPHSKVCQLLERASNSFINDARYKNDPRYLRCWLQYSKHVRRLKEHFAFLKSNGIGLDLATYYEEYAELMEEMKCFKEANEIFETGISRRAQPLGRLNKRYKQFLTRMESNGVNFNTTVTQLNLNPRRTILGSKSSASSTQSQPMNVFHQRNPISHVVSDVGSTNVISNNNNNNGKLDIFYDPYGEVGNAAITSTDSGTSTWNNYGTYLTRKKEDIREAEQWRGVTLPQNKKVYTPMVAKLEVYRDKSVEHDSTNIRQCNEQINKKETTFQEKRPKQVKRYELGQKERWSIKINDFYDENDDEISFEEKRAKALELLEVKLSEIVEDKFEPQEKNTNDKKKITLQSCNIENTPEAKHYVLETKSPVLEQIPIIQPSKTECNDIEEYNIPVHKINRLCKFKFLLISIYASDNTLTFVQKLASDMNTIVKKPSPTICTKAALSDIIGMFTFTQPSKDIRNHNIDDENVAPNTNVVHQQSANSNHSQKPSKISQIDGRETDDQKNNENSRGNKSKNFDTVTPIKETRREYMLITTPSRELEQHAITEVRPSTNESGFGDTRADSVSPIECIEEDSLESPTFTQLSNPCNPLDRKVIEQILVAIRPPVNRYKGFYDAQLQTFNHGSKIEEIARSWNVQSRRGTSILINGDKPVIFFNDSFLINQKIDEGGYGKIYRVLDTNDFADDQDEKKSSRALKIETPSSAWEFYIIRQLQERIISPTIDSIISVYSLYCYKDESYMVMEFCHQGTILDAINKAKKDNSQLDELLVFFFTIELLKTMESIHQAGIIHGDIKADNCILRLEPTVEWGSRYDPSGANGWSKKGIKLIDFGRSIDVTLFPNDMKFIAEWVTDDQDCVEMREGRPWKWQADYYGLAGVVHCMLHNQYMQITPILAESNNLMSGPATMALKRYKPILSFKRYWQGELWQKLFDLLLNPLLAKKDGQMPITQELKNIREEFEQYLIQNCEKNGKSLKGLLKKLEVS